MVKNVRVYYVLILASTVITGCSCKEASNSAVGPSRLSDNNSIKTNLPYESILWKITYPFEMGDEEKNKFLGTLKTLKPGDEYDTVVRFLGRPYSQHLIAGKEPRAPVRGISLTYYLKKPGDGVNDKYDHNISLDFDTNKRLTAIDTNIAGLTFGSLTGINTGMTKMDEVEKSALGEADTE